MSTVLKTDKYELTMLEAFIENGMHNNKAVFELFGRKLPEGRRYGVVAGTARAIEAILNFTFQKEDLDHLKNEVGLKDTTIDYLKNYSFSGNVYGYQEGDYWFPYAPLLTIESTLGEAVILETLLLSIFNYDSAVASAASHMREIAPNANLMEFGARRVNEDAAVVASRAAYIGGFNSTSNLEANRKYGVPVYGTSAHAFTLAFPTEKEAFAAQVKTFGPKTTLLVDTYDITQGVINAVEAAGTELGAVRIDSGDPFEVIPAVRKQLDDLGAVNTKIALSGDVKLENLQGLIEANLPIDSYGIGTDVVTGSGVVASGFVYKLVAVEQNGQMVPVAKKGAGAKNSKGGRKFSYRIVELDGTVKAEIQETTPREIGWGISIKQVPLQRQYIKEGQQTLNETLEEVRNRHMNLLQNFKITKKPDVLVDNVNIW